MRSICQGADPTHSVDDGLIAGSRTIRARRSIDHRLIETDLQWASRGIDHTQSKERRGQK